MRFEDTEKWPQLFLILLSIFETTWDKEILIIDSESA